MRITDGVPEYQSVLGDLLDVILTAIEAVDKGATDARQFQQDREFKFDADLANAIVRKWVKQALANYAAAVSEFNVNDDIRLIGLRFQYGQYDVCIWKTKDGELPYPGRSRRKRAFLSNGAVPRQLLLGEEFYPEWDRVNVVIMWSAGVPFSFDSAYLSLPKAPPEKYFGHPESYWTERLPDITDLLGMRPHPQLPPNPSGGDVPFEEPDEEDMPDTGENAR